MELIQLADLHAHNLGEETWLLFDEFHASVREEGSMLVGVPFDDDGLVEFNDRGDLVHANTGLWLEVKKHDMVATIEGGEIMIRSVPDQDELGAAEADLFGNFAQQLTEALDNIHEDNVATEDAL